MVGMLGWFSFMLLLHLMSLPRGGGQGRHKGRPGDFTQVQDEAAGLPLHSANDHPGLPEVALGVARRMGQRHGHSLVWRRRSLT